MKLTILVLFLFLCFSSHAQTNRYLKLSGGKIGFGTGDVSGVAIYPEYSFGLGKSKQNYWRHFQFGGELGFETGVKNPVVVNPPFSDYWKGFYHVSNLAAHIKLTYYPISSTFLRGFNVALGPTLGYTYLSKEAAYSILAPQNGDTIRTSHLDYNNRAFAGYIISLGYEYFLNNTLIGVRADFINNLNGDMNIMYGLKLGWRL